MKEKLNFIYNSVRAAMDDVKAKRISVDQAKAVAALAKQANNVIVSQIDAAKFLSTVKDSRELLKETGLIDDEKD